MENRTIFKVEKPKTYVISPSVKGYEDYDVVGFDTETVNGELYSFQFHSEKVSIFENDLKKYDEFNDIQDFVKILNPTKTTFIFAHNLEFDMGVMFDKFINNYLSEYDVDDFYREKAIKVKALYPSPSFMRLTHAVNYVSPNGKRCRKNVSVFFIDTLPFFRMSLQKAGERFNLPVQKLKRPEYLGKREPTDSEMPYFKKYAMYDAIVVYYLGKMFMEFHRKYDVNPIGTVSPASYSSKVFRRKFLQNDIEFPKMNEVVYYAMRSYWGGRTECFCGGTTPVRIYDYNSFYPYAMTQIYIPVEKDKWKPTTEFMGEYGFYKVRGYLDSSHKISPVPKKRQRLLFPVGKFETIVTGFEAKTILDNSDKAEIVSGYYYDGKQDFSLSDYVMDFYQQKKMINPADNPSGYHLTKLLLNSLYGKFIQMNRGSMSVYLRDSFGEERKWGKRYVASGLFNPVVASWITGFCRSRLFEAMKKKESRVAYCDTDSIGIVKGSLPESSRLGGLKIEGKGVGTFIREKLYLIYDREGNLTKKGTHGFWSKPDTLKEMLENGVDTYTVSRLVKLREAYRQGKQPFIEEIQNRSLGLYTSMKRKNSRTMNFLEEFSWLDPIEVRDY